MSKETYYSVKRDLLWLWLLAMCVHIAIDTDEATEDIEASFPGAPALNLLVTCHHSRLVHDMPFCD